MELAIIIVANVALLVMLVLAVRLFRRSDGPIADDETTGSAASAATVARDPASGASDASRAAERIVDVGSAAPSPTEPDHSVDPGDDLEPVEPRWGDPTATPTYSVIEVHASFNGSGPRPEHLYADVIDVLGSVGFARVGREGGHTIVLRDPMGRLVKSRAGRDGDGRVRIDLAIDSDVAVETLARLEVWHRERLEHSDRLRLRAQIR